MNEIKTAGKILGAFLLISFTALAIIFLVAYLPDKMPDPHSNRSTYEYRLFHIHLIDTCLSNHPAGQDSATKKGTAAKKDTTLKDTTVNKQVADSPKK